MEQKKEEHAKTQNVKDTLIEREQNGTQRAPFPKRHTAIPNFALRDLQTQIEDEFLECKQSN